jgi:hypothetical protein
MISRFFAVAFFASAFAMQAQQEGAVPTQSIVTVDAKTPPTLTTEVVKAKVNRRDASVTRVDAVRPNGTQVALLIDDGLRTSVGRQLADLRSFITALPPGVEVLVGYMQNGRVVPAQPFTTNHAAAAANLRLPMGAPGLSASPYFCLSDFVKKWPGGEGTDASAPVIAKARFVMMLTNGVDPYNGSVSPLNQSSPYVDAAIADAQRAGTPVYSIYYGDAGIRGGAASFSGQNYLTALAESTGGRAYYQGMGNPVSLTPFLKQFTAAIAESYIVTYDAAGTRLVDVSFSTSLPKTKLRASKMVMPGRRLASGD